MPRQPRILFVSLFDDIGSDRIVAAMGRDGAECGVIGAPEAFAARSRFVSKFFRLPSVGGYWARSVFFGRRLDRIARKWRPDLVVPLDEFSARTLRDPRLYREAEPSVRRLLQRSLGAPANFDTICSRHRIVETARAIGVETPCQEAVADLAAARRVAASFGYPVVLKREQTCGGAGVAIVPDEASLTRAYRRASLKAATKRAVQRVLGFGTVDQAALVLQRHVPGPLAFRVAACAEGVVLDGISFLAECTHPAATGASTVLRPIERPDMDEATRHLVAALGCSGLVSLDFILAPNGAACLIEMNPRPVASGHLGRLYGHDIYRALLDNVRGTQADPCSESAAPPSTIALFPRELDRDPRSAHVDAPSEVFHDIPWDDPDVVEAYAAWLERRHPAERLHLREMLSGKGHGRGRRLRVRPPIACPAEVSVPIPGTVAPPEAPRPRRPSAIAGARVRRSSGETRGLGHPAEGMIGTS